MPDYHLDFETRSFVSLQKCRVHRIDETCLEGPDFERICAVLDGIRVAMWGFPTSEKARE